MKVAIYEPDFCTNIGGGNFYSAAVIDFFNREYPDAEIDIIAERTKADFDLTSFVNKYYGFEYNDRVKTRYVKKGSGIISVTRTSKRYDIFFNCVISLDIGRAKKNAHIIHFRKELPGYGAGGAARNFLKKIYYGYIARVYPKAYDLYLCNSRFTELWFKQYWPNIKRVEQTYPPVKMLTYNERENNRKPVIFICSRFTPDKKIDVMLKYFIESERLNKNARLVIAGSIGASDIEKNILPT